MNGLLAIIFLGLSTWTLIALFRRLLRRRVARSWWGALSFLIACGMGLGIWCALYCEYPVGSHFRFGSFPIPAVVFHLEDGNWVDFPLQEFWLWAVVAANIITVVALATIPLWLAPRNKQKHENTGLEA
jgi:NO-binding membrane sensor protein with MHYT domain